MSLIKRAMPLLAANAGEWKGVYADFDADNNHIETWKSHLTCAFPDDGSSDYYQINRYYHDDGQTEEFHYPGVFHNGRVWFDTERIKGSAWEEGDGVTLQLFWERKDLPGMTLHEMIQLNEAVTERCRVWQWLEHGVLVKRTLIKESRAD